MNRDEFLRKFLSRKFLAAMLGAVLAFLAQDSGKPIPWEVVSVLMAYIAGEAGIDVVRMIRPTNKPGAP